MRLDFRPDRGKFCRADDMESLLGVWKCSCEHTVLISCASDVLDVVVVSISPPKSMQTNVILVWVAQGRESCKAVF